MNEPMSNPYPPNAQADLARERNRLAANRSLLSFIRNSVTLISIGIGIDQVVRNVAPAAPFIELWAYGLNLVLAGLGVLNLLFAAQDYRDEMKRLSAPEYHFTSRWSLGALTGVVLFVAGFLVFIRLGIRVFS